MIKIIKEKFFRKNQKNINNLKPLDEIIEKDDSSLEKLIEIKNIEKSFGFKKVLKGINLNLLEGENIALLGSNGAGKTTLVEIIIQLSKYDSGKIIYNFGSIPINKAMGIQFQNVNFSASLKIKDIVSFIMDLYKIKIQEEEIKHLFKIFDLEKFYNIKASKLSGGQKQRVNVLLSLLHKPKVLILDEFSTGLDFLIKTQIENFLQEYLSKYKTTLIIVSHDISEIETFADRIVLLDQGKVVVSMKKETLIKKFGSIKEFLLKYIR